MCWDAKPRQKVQSRSGPRGTKDSTFLGGPPVGNSVTPYEQRVINGRKGGYRSQSPERLAMRLVEGWPDFTQQQRDVIRTIMRPVIGRRAVVSAPAEGDAR
jgi:hypothetical protein